MALLDLPRALEVIKSFFNEYPTLVTQLLNDFQKYHAPLGDVAMQLITYAEAVEII